MKQLDEYFKLQKEIYDYFGYEDGNQVFPIDNCTKYFWQLNEYTVSFADTKKEFESETGNYYEVELLYVSIDAIKAGENIFRTDYFTAILVDTRTGGNKFLSIFDNSMELKHVK